METNTHSKHPHGHTLPGTRTPQHAPYRAQEHAGTGRHLHGHRQAPSWAQANTLLGAGALLAITGFLFIAVTGLPDFGNLDNRHITEYYLEKGFSLTGSPNIVNAIIWDFRGYDTLGEETVLFCAALSVFMIIRRKKYGRRD